MAPPDEPGNVSALERIARELVVLVNSATDESPIEPHEVRIIARKFEAQIEMREKGLVE